MVGSASQSKLLRTVTLSLVAGFAALLAFMLFRALELGSPYETIVAIVVGLAVGLALERRVPMPD